MNTYFIIRDREAGNKIDEFKTLVEAKTALHEYEQEDKDNDSYAPDFYEIVEAQTVYHLIDCGSTSCRYNFKNVRGKFDTLEEALKEAAAIVEAGKYDEETGEEVGWRYGEGPRHEYSIEEVNEDGDFIQGWAVNEDGELR